MSQIIPTFLFKLPHRSTFSANQEADVKTKAPTLPTMIENRGQVAFGVTAAEHLMMRRKQQVKCKNGRWSAFEANQFLHCIYKHRCDNLGKTTQTIETR